MNKKISTLQITKRGISLIEIIVTLGIIVLLSAVGVSSIKLLSSHAQIPNAVINGLLSTARAIATKESRYVGVRFQQANDGRQYAIFIIYEPKIPYPVNLSDPTDPNNSAVPFVAMNEHKAIDMGAKYGIASEIILMNRKISKSNTRVSFIFSSQGRLVRQWHGVYRNPQKPTDEYFNDTYPALFKEDAQIQLSDSSFVIYDRLEDFNSPAAFDNLKALYINRYTGQVIHTD